MTDPIEERLRRAESELAALTAELAALRQAVAVPAVVAPPAQVSAARPPAQRPQPRPHAPRAASLPDSNKVERLLGRYGMLGLAVLTAVFAVGTFLSWAIAHGYLTLTPAERVAVGLVFAAAIGAWGIHMRKRERSFGSSLVGLALVIVQVCAYAAGPWFHIVPSEVAFVGAAAVSWALALWSHAESDQPLWCVAFGGAALAPFVTSDGGGHLIALAVYGTIVMLPASFAISHRNWLTGWRVYYAVAALYAVAIAYLARNAGLTGFTIALAFPFVVAAFGVVPFASRTRKRAALRWLALLAALTSLGTIAPYTTGEHQTVAALLLAAAALWLVLVDRHAQLPQTSLLGPVAGRRAFAGVTTASPSTIDDGDFAAQLDWCDALIIPAILVWHAGTVAPDMTAQLIVYGLATFIATVFAWRRERGSLRDAAALGASAALMTVVLLPSVEEPLTRTVALVATSLALLAMARVRPSWSWFAGAGASMTWAVILVVEHLYLRPLWGYTPLATEASGAALIVLLGLIVAYRLRKLLAGTAEPVLDVVRSGPWVWAFFWIWIEIARAWSQSSAMLAQVIYFAAMAVACVGAGRVLRRARVRQIGLLLALASAGAAFVGATSYFEIGTRIAAYLVTSAFLLGIAYWYRRTGVEAAPAE